MKYFLHRSNLWIYFRLLSKSSKNLPEAETSINQNVLNTHCSTGLSAPSFPFLFHFCYQKHNLIWNPQTTVAITADGAALYWFSSPGESNDDWGEEPLLEESFCTELHLQWQQELLILSLSPAMGPQGDCQELTSGWWIPRSGLRKKFLSKRQHEPNSGSCFESSLQQLLFSLQVLH